MTQINTQLRKYSHKHFINKPVVPYQQDDGWTQVRYGGRRGRLRECTDQMPRNSARGTYSWDRRGRDFGWKASAPPV